MGEAAEAEAEAWLSLPCFASHCFAVSARMAQEVANLFKEDMAR